MVKESSVWYKKAARDNVDLVIRKHLIEGKVIEEYCLAQGGQA
jgi:(2Fe-2S) ferredoxin